MTCLMIIIIILSFLPIVKTPVELLRLSSPPHTATPVTFEEAMSLDGGDGQFEEDEDGNLLLRDEVSGSELVRLHFSVDYFEVLETEVYGEYEWLKHHTFEKLC